MIFYNVKNAIFLVCGDLSPIGELSTGEFSCDTRSVFDGKSVSDLRAAVDKCCSMTPNVHTVITCATLAQQFSDLALEVSRSCDQLVHEQHLQHQVSSVVVFKYSVTIVGQYAFFI